MRLAGEAKDEITVKALAAQVETAPLEPAQLVGIARGLSVGGYHEQAAKFLTRAATDALATSDRNAMARLMVEGSVPEGATTLLPVARFIAADGGFAIPSMQAARKAAESIAGQQAEVAGGLSGGGLSPGVSGWSEVQLDAFEALLAAQPAEALKKYGLVAMQTYVRLKQIPRLRAALEAAPRRRTLAKGGSSQEATLTPLVDLLTGLAEPGLALTVFDRIRDGIDRPSARLRGKYLDLAQAAGCLDKIDATGVEWLWWELRPQPVLFMFDRFSHQEDTEVSLDPRLVEVARVRGKLGELQQRALALDPENKAGSLLRVWLRVIAREPEVLPEVRRLKARLPYASRSEWPVQLLRELAAWPAAGKAAGEFFEALDAVPGAHSERLGTWLEIGRLAAGAGQVELARTMARRLLEGRGGEALERKAAAIASAGQIALTLGDAALAKQSADQFTRLIHEEPHWNDAEVGAGARLVSLLNDGHFTADGAALAREMTEVFGSKLAESGPSLLRTLAVEASIDKPALPGLSPVLWVDVESSTAERATVCWDFSPVGEDFDAGSFAVRAKPLPVRAPAGELELYIGETPDAMQPIAHVASAQMQGQWQGKLPLLAGYLRPVLASGEEKRIGSPTPFTIGTNLWQMPASASVKSGQAEISAWPPSRRLGIPAFTGSGEYPRISAGTAVLSPAESFVFSGWVKCASPGSLTLQLLYLDEHGSVISSKEMRPSAGEWWKAFRLRLQRGGDSADAIPPGATRAELMVESTHDGGEIAEVTLVEAQRADKAGESQTRPGK